MKLYKLIEKYSNNLKTKLAIDSFITLTTYFQIYSPFLKWLYNDSPLTPYINDDKNPDSLKHQIEHILRSQAQDFLGAYFLTATFLDISRILKKYEKNNKAVKYLRYFIKTPATAALTSFSLLSGLELAQKYHLISGVYDEKDIVAYGLGSLLAMFAEAYLKKYRK